MLVLLAGYSEAIRGFWKLVESCGYKYSNHTCSYLKSIPCDFLVSSHECLPLGFILFLSWFCLTGTSQQKDFSVGALCQLDGFGLFACLCSGSRGQSATQLWNWGEKQCFPPSSSRWRRLYRGTETPGRGAPGHCVARGHQAAHCALGKPWSHLSPWELRTSSSQQAAQTTCSRL